jgi:hypothetical protein
LSLFAAGALTSAWAAFMPSNPAADIPATEAMAPSSLRRAGKPSLEIDECIQRFLLTN